MIQRTLAYTALAFVLAGCSVGDTQPAAEEPTAKAKSPAKPTAKLPARKSAPAKSATRGKARR